MDPLTGEELEAIRQGHVYVTTQGHVLGTTHVDLLLATVDALKAENEELREEVYKANLESNDLECDLSALKADLDEALRMLAELNHSVEGGTIPEVDALLRKHGRLK